MKHIYFLFLLISATAFAQEPIETDRPGQSSTPSTVPANHFQMETGLRHTQAEPRHPQWQLPASLLKYGVNDKFELRLNAQYAYNKTPDSTNSGFKPLVGGVKAKLSEEKGWLPAAAVLINFTIPNAASESFKTDYLAPEVVFLMKNSVGNSAEIQYNIGVSWDGQSPGPSYLYTFSPNFDLTDKLGMFIESYAYFPEHAHPDHWVDGGLTFLITNTIQFDVSAGYELSSHDNHHSFFESIGFSFRI